MWSAHRRRLDRMEESLARIEHAISRIFTQGAQLMSAISDYVAKQKAHNDAVSSDLDTIQTAIGALNDKIAQLQNSPGQITPADQALLDGIEQDGQALQAKADALAGKAPPTPPAGQITPADQAAMPPATATS